MKPIATRYLSFSKVGEASRQDLTIKVEAPYVPGKKDVGYEIAPGAAICKVTYEGFEEAETGDIYGSDTVQALELAISGIDSNLKRFTNNYDFFFRSGEPYFETK